MCGGTQVLFVNFPGKEMFDLQKCLFLTTFIFDSYHSSWAAATPVRYNCSIQI